VQAAGYLSILVPDGPLDVEVPALVHLAASLTVFSAGLTSLSLPLLARVDGEVNVQSNPQLATLSIPSLTSSRGEFQVLSNGSGTDDATSVTCAEIAAVLEGVTQCPDDMSTSDGTGNACNLTCPLLVP
jgi:hypothetical protein